MVERLKFNVAGQTLRHVPGRRITAATYALEDMRLGTTDPNRTLASGTATLDAATQALTATAGPSQANPRRIPVAATAAFSVGTPDRPNFYWLVDANGEAEPIVCAGIETNAAVIAAHPLTRAYAITTSTLQGMALTSAALAIGIVNNESRLQGDDPMRAVWTYANGERHQELVRLVRDDYSDADIAQAIADIRDLFPDIATRMYRDGRDTLPTHVNMQRRQIRAEWIDRRENPEAILTGEQGHWVLVWRTLHHLAQLGNAPSSDNLTIEQWALHCREQKQAAWSRLISGEGGLEVQKQDPATATAGSSTDRTYRRVISEL